MLGRRQKIAGELFSGTIFDWWILGKSLYAYWKAIQPGLT